MTSEPRTETPAVTEAHDHQRSGSRAGVRRLARSAWEAGGIQGLVVVAFVLRLHEMTAVPPLSANHDPIAFAWSGLTLITRHYPSSWSWLPAYEAFTWLPANGTTYRIVAPWLDHPPLFSLVLGAWVWLQGARELVDVTHRMVVGAAVGLSLVSLMLAYRLGSRVLGNGPAALAALLLATSPYAVLLSRQAVTEALLAPILLTGLILLHRIWSGEAGRFDEAALLACSLSAPLVKVPGVLVVACFAAILLFMGRGRLALAVAAAGLGGIALYAAYGALLDWDIFVAVIRSHEDRRGGVMGAYEFIAGEAGVGRAARDGWWLLGWIAIGLLILRSGALHLRRALLVALPPAIYAAGLVILAVEGNVQSYGWYKIAVYPLVYLTAGLFVWQAVAHRSIPALLLVAGLGGATATTALFGQEGQAWMPPAYVLGAILAALLIPPALAAWRRDSALLQAVERTAAAGVVALILLANAAESWGLARAYRLL